MSDKIIRWGIVGTGYAKEFAKALAVFPDAVDKLARDPDVDVVYICSAPQIHAEHTFNKY